MISSSLDTLESFCRCRWPSILLNILGCSCSPWSVWNTCSCLTCVLICCLIHSDSRWWLELLYWLSISNSYSSWYWICLYWLLVRIVLLNYILLLLINICTWIQSSNWSSILILNSWRSLLNLFLLIAVGNPRSSKTHHCWWFSILLLKRSSLSSWL